MDAVFSPDSRQLAFGQGDRILTIDLASGKETNRWRLPSKAYTLAFHPRDRRLAVGYSESRVASVYDSAQGSHVADLPVGLMNDQVVAWHPDGARLAVAGTDPRIQIWDVAAKRRLAMLEGHVEPVRGLSFHPDGGSAGVGLVGRCFAPLGFRDGTATHAIAARRDTRNSATTAVGWDPRGKAASSGNCWRSRPAANTEPSSAAWAPVEGIITTATSVPTAACWRWAWAARATDCGICPAGGNSPCFLREATVSSFSPTVANYLAVTLPDCSAGRFRRVRPTTSFAWGRLRRSRFPSFRIGPHAVRTAGRWR